MGFASQKWVYICLIIGLIVVLFHDIGFADERGNIQYQEYLALESLKAEQEFQKFYSYRYYPSHSVYYDINRELYYYFQDGYWKIFASLPPKFNKGLGDCVELELDTNTPYTYHDKHIKEYPSKDSKKRKKNMWSKIFFVLFYEHASK
jgi:hypothetical protein